MSDKLSVPAKSLPDESTLAAAANFEVFDATGNVVKFGELFKERKTVVVFIRHFFCGTCRSYVKQLAEIPDKALDDANVRIVIVGCGEHEPIKHYMEATGFRGSIYANPTRTVYHALGMDLETLKRTPKGEEKKSYVPPSLIVNAVTGIVDGLRNFPLIGKHGNISQAGGEFIIGPGNVCSFASRMQHSEDHIEVSDLMKEAGVSV